MAMELPDVFAQALHTVFDIFVRNAPVVKAVLHVFKQPRYSDGGVAQLF